MDTESSYSAIRPAAADWQEWRRECAADRCSPSASANLKRFGKVRFATYCRRYASTTGDSQPLNKDFVSPEQDAAWHLLETHCHVGRNRAGKSYKNWLFARAVGAANWSAAIEAGATLLMRDVVRGHLRREHSARFMCSLDAAHDADASGQAWSLAELIPDSTDPLSGIEEREMQELAINLAHQQCAHLSALERVVLVASAHKIPFNHIGLQHCCGRKKSTLATTYQHVLKELAARIRTVYPEQSAALCVAMLRFTIAKLVKQIIIEKMLDDRATCFFMSQGIESIAGKDDGL